MGGRGGEEEGGMGGETHIRAHLYVCARVTIQSCTPVPCLLNDKLYITT